VGKEAVKNPEQSRKARTCILDSEFWILDSSSATSDLRLPLLNSFFRAVNHLNGSSASDS